MEHLRYNVLARPRIGLVLEFGVFRGETLNFIASQDKSATIFGFDSFCGLPMDWREGFHKGMFATELPVTLTNASLVIGQFAHSLPHFLATHPDPISFMHIDCDLYESTRTIFEFCGSRLVHGTKVVFDEYYNYPGWLEHEHKAFLEYSLSARRAFDYTSFVLGGEQVGITIIE
jgi:hypothetical protein